MRDTCSVSRYRGTHDMSRNAGHLMCPAKKTITGHFNCCANGNTLNFLQFKFPSEKTLNGLRFSLSGIPTGSSEDFELLCFSISKIPVWKYFELFVFFVLVWKLCLNRLWIFCVFHCLKILSKFRFGKLWAFYVFPCLKSPFEVLRTFYGFLCWNTRPNRLWFFYGFLRMESSFENTLYFLRFWFSEIYVWKHFEL